MHDGDFVELFSGYWWLIFPVGWGIAELVRSWQRARQAEKAMDIVKGYADQGKEPPADVLKLLQPEARSDPASAARRGRDRAQGFLLTAFIFVALSAAFGVMMHWGLRKNGEDNAGLLFVTVLMGGFAVAFFISAFVARRDARHDVFKDGA